MSTTPTPRRVIRLDDDTFWAAQHVRGHLGTTADALASIDRTLTHTARTASIALGIIAGAATVAAVAATIGEVRR